VYHHKDGPVGPYRESQEGRNTKRVAKDGRLAARPSGRKRKREVRRPSKPSSKPLW